MKRIICSSLATLFIASICMASPEKPEANDKEIKKTLELLDTFSKVLSYVDGHYIHDTKTFDLVHGAIDGMLRKLDPHTVFLPPKRFDSMRQTTSGEFSGIGLEIVVEEKAIVVVTPIEGSPAAEKGIQPGDMILEINGLSTQGLAPDQAQELLKQPNKNGFIELLIQQKENGITRIVEISPRKIRLKSVKHHGIGDLGYIKITSFQENTAKSVVAAIEKLKARKRGLRGIILDMRNNPGGLLSEAVSVADLFVHKGIIVAIKGRKADYTENRSATLTTPAKSVPTVALINGGTASAPEIVAGALKDHKAAVLMGKRTFGKGSVQTIIDLEDGSGLKLTVATYLTPKGLSIQARGISPDIEVDQESTPTFNVITDPVREEDLANHLEVKETRIGKSSLSDEVRSDVQLMHAVDHLHAWLTFSNKRT